MKFPDEIKSLIDQIPPEYHENISKIMAFSRRKGFESIMNLVKDLSEISPCDVDCYSIERTSTTTEE